MDAFRGIAWDAGESLLVDGDVFEFDIRHADNGSGGTGDHFGINEIAINQFGKQRFVFGSKLLFDFGNQPTISKPLTKKELDNSNFGIFGKQSH